ncbi:MAG: DUF3035 domain-containing protein [Candidatus Pelagibacter bacterium]|jgi:hypothetical protein|nr:DUF3035 domain-containing protein [Candidatus Pelagibacter bacterium]MDB9745824.1 DUF3035 domain-containing protein [Candidatus Pelagibacter sp.]MDF1857815.1 DUF3035 domain-containing protein [Candidatus Pelagibacter bacterium]|tara:strand:- start:833 stop:1150 length:318 start_codon:yes stop_codon:yes gene_type:complete
MKINNIILILLVALVGLSCQSIKDGLSGKKSENSDEFLVQKKSPLVLPPKFLELPQPKDKDEENIQLEEEIDIEKILSIKSQTISETNKSNKTAEDFVLKNIKNN